MPRYQQSVVFQRCTTINRRLRSRFARVNGDLPLLSAFNSPILAPKTVEIWRMLVNCLAAQEVWVDLVPGMPLAGIPLRSDRPQPELSHQPPDAPAAHRNPLSQQRHLEPAASVDWTVCENPVEPLQKLEFLRRFRPRPVVASLRTIGS
jgi:hypothetical protein